VIVVYSAQSSQRLRYVLRWLFRELLHTDFLLITDKEDVVNIPFFISYGERLPNALCIPDNGLLWQTEIREHKVETGYWNEIPTLYPHTDSGFDIPFDIFSAIFFLLSRYEEYCPFEADKHGRYPATESLLFKIGALERPLVDEWVFAFYDLLKHRTDVEMSLSEFQYRPTYDIDIAFSYKFKGFARTAGAFAKDLLQRNFSNFTERAAVVFSSKQDPYDSFDWLRQLHKQYGLRPHYFVLSTLSTTAFDKNIHPEKASMQQLIRSFEGEGSVGLHPSYYSFRKEVFTEEKKILERIVQAEVTQSRQHYIRLQMPQTYRFLTEQRISDDWSMGYGSHLGFRAGTGRAFYWYDFEKEKQSLLKLHPFCFMDSTAHFEGRLTSEEAFSKLNAMTEVLKETKSELVTVFHNFSLGSDAQWKGWKDAYENFISSL